MRQAGVSPARESRRSRAWVDFGVDESWEPAPRRRRVTGASRADVAAAEPRDGLSEHRDSLLERDHDLLERRGDLLERRGDLLEPPPPVAHAFSAAYEPVEADYEAIARAGYATASPPAAVDAANELGSDADGVGVSSPSASAGGVPGRRTVTIRGRGAERDLALPSYRSANRPTTPRRERPGYKPDRVAMWAVLLGICLVLVAATSSHAATLHRAMAGHATAARHVALVAPACRATARL